MARLRRDVDLDAYLDYLTHTAGPELERQQELATAAGSWAGVVQTLHETARMCREAAAALTSDPPPPEG